jgi:hypothetical protein
MPSLSFRVESFRGTAAGWVPASAAIVTAETAARRLRLYRAVRGADWLYRVAPVTLPGEDPAAVAALPVRRSTGAALPAFI